MNTGKASIVSRQFKCLDFKLPGHFVKMRNQKLVVTDDFCQEKIVLKDVSRDVDSVQGSVCFLTWRFIFFLEENRIVNNEFDGSTFKKAMALPFLYYKKRNTYTLTSSTFNKLLPQLIGYCYQ